MYSKQFLAILRSVLYWTCSSPFPMSWGLQYTYYLRWISSLVDWSLKRFSSFRDLSSRKLRRAKETPSLSEHQKSQEIQGKHEKLLCYNRERPGAKRPRGMAVLRGEKEWVVDECKVPSLVSDFDGLLRSNDDINSDFSNHQLSWAASTALCRKNNSSVRCSRLHKFVPTAGLVFPFWRWLVSRK